MTEGILRLPCWDPTSPRQQGVWLSYIEAWTSTPELWQAVMRTGGEDRRALRLGARLAYLNAFAQEHWDFRQGAERNLVDVDAPVPELEKEATAAADVLGLIDAGVHTRPEYDDMLILGGLVRACVARARFSAELVASGVRTRSIVALGGFRPLRGDEIELARQLGVDAVDEFQAMEAGLRRAFPQLRPTTQEGEGRYGDNAAWRIHQFSHPEGWRALIIAAPSTEPTVRRANSADTYRFFAEHVTEIRGRHLLLLTNPIYRVYQHAMAIAALGLPYDAKVETLGTSPSSADFGEFTQTFQWHHYLQELRSSLYGLEQLHRALEI